MAGGGGKGSVSRRGCMSRRLVAEAFGDFWGNYEPQEMPGLWDARVWSPSASGLNCLEGAVSSIEA